MSSNISSGNIDQSSTSSQVDPDYQKEIFLKQLGEHVYQQNMKKINAEFFNVTYGSFVRTLIDFYDSDADKCNQKLKAMGENIGARLIDDFYSKVTNQIPRCSNLKDLGNTIAYVGFKMYINTVPRVMKATELSSSGLMVAPISSTSSLNSQMTSKKENYIIRTSFQES